MDSQTAKSLMEEKIQDLIDTCPHCGARVHIEKLSIYSHKFKNRDLEFYGIFRCKPCQKLILKTFYFKQNRYAHDREDLEAIGWKEKFPITLDSELDPSEIEHIPEDVYSDYLEALKCKSTGAYRASCAMFRRSLQSALVILGADEKFNLVKQIESLNSLPSDIKQWAHQIRILGNWGAHPDKDNLKEVEEDDASEVHDFVSKLLIYLFVMPEKVKFSRKKREAKLLQEEQ